MVKTIFLSLCTLLRIKLKNCYCFGPTLILQTPLNNPSKTEKKSSCTIFVGFFLNFLMTIFCIQTSGLIQIRIAISEFVSVKHDSDTEGSGFAFALAACYIWRSSGWKIPPSIFELIHVYCDALNSSRYQNF